MTTGSNRRLRVLTLVDGLGASGGGESVARQIAVSLDQRRYEPIYCVSRAQPPEAYRQAMGEFEQAGVELIGLQRRSKADFGPWGRLVSQMRRRKVDVLHTHKIGSNIWGALLSPLARPPVFVAHEHTWSFEGQPLRRFLDRQLIARRADAFVAVSREDQRRMHEIERIPMSRLRFIPNGIPASEPPDPAVDLRAELEIPAEAPVVGTVATLRPQKALDVLIRATVPLARRFPEICVLIAGGESHEEGSSAEPERERLTALAGSLGVAGNVRFLGHRSDVPNVLAVLDVAVLSSDYEGSPLSVLEYMDAGKPVVSTRVGGVPDLVDDGVTGYLVDPQDPEGLAAAVAAVLEEPLRAREMGRLGRERRQREFSLQGMTRRVEALYEELYALSG